MESIRITGHILHPIAVVCSLQHDSRLLIVVCWNQSSQSGLAATGRIVAFLGYNAITLHLLH
jgi:hypothetical protein